MFLVITIASCTSSETFSEIYTLVTEFFSISRSALSASLRSSPYFGHFICYTLLSLSLAGVFSRRNKFLAPLVAGVFGLLMEGVQFFIPSRDSSLLDMGVNIFGIAVGFGTYWLWVTYRRRPRKSD
ncbi:MAG: VanZ family protein [Lysobacterales bacterium]